ncbi:MAG TPA: glycosyltransferase family 2 protein [Gemmatimonadales bacterium]|nr:glycosyltransferase family 2 protein [Gemmatimonadales bacterium]
MTDDSPVAQRLRVFIVVPAFNEATSIRAVIDRLRSTYEHIIVVDDGSTDGTAQALAGARITLLRHRINRGQGAALQTGITFALLRGADVVVTFDSDGQHDPEDIEAMTAPILSGDCDVTLGSRFLGHTHNMPLGRRLVLKAGIVFTRLISRIRVTDVHNGIRAFSRDAAGSLRISMDRMAHASEILDQIAQHRWRYREIPVTIRYSAQTLAKGQSSWNALRIAAQVLMERLKP